VANASMWASTYYAVVHHKRALRTFGCRDYMCIVCASEYLALVTSFWALDCVTAALQYNRQDWDLELYGLAPAGTYLTGHRA
jgi:hypothetical protein